MRVIIAKFLFIALFWLFLIALVFGVPWNFLDVAGRAWLALMFATVALAARPRWIRLGYAALTVLMLIWGSMYLSEAFPMQLRLHAENFENQSVHSILGQISQQRDRFPLWRFFVHPDIARKNIKLEITENDSLGDALNRLCRATDCQFDWHWHAPCGNAPTPGCAEITIYPRGNTPSYSETAGWMVYSKGPGQDNAGLATEANEQSSQ
jgi:hypothetical protein